MVFCSQLDLKHIGKPKRNFWFSRGDTPVFIYRGGWDSKEDTYLGVKGGSPSTSHAHMDAGSFVYDAYGVRWSMDFGLQSYTTLESKLSALGGNLWDMGQNSMRWDVFRLNNLNHSTISINDARHRVNGVATLTTTINTATELGATFDLTEVVSDQAASATRTVKIVNDKDLVVMVLTDLAGIGLYDRPVIQRIIEWGKEPSSAVLEPGLYQAWLSTPILYTSQRHHTTKAEGEDK